MFAEAEAGPAAETRHPVFRRYTADIQQPYAVERCQAGAAAKAQIISTVVYKTPNLLHAFFSEGLTLV